MKQRTPGGGHKAHDLLHEAMAHYAKAEAIRPAGHDDAILRWNRCARLLRDHPGFREEGEAEAFDAIDSSPV